MPYKIVKSGGKYNVVNTESGSVKARGTTKEKAEAQVRFLRGLEHGMKPRGGK